MAANLDSLPLEILFEVWKYLDLLDFVSTVQVNKTLYQKLRGNQLSRFILKVCLGHQNLYLEANKILRG